MSLTVAVPTWNNPGQLTDALLSLVHNTDFSGRVLVINNGEPCYERIQGSIPYEVDWIDAGKNLGWMGGVNLALKHADTSLFCMMNDDVIFPYDQHFWEKTQGWFHLPEVGGVGPSSNYVAGFQSIHAYPSHPMLSVQFLIGFCATYRTETLKKLGGLDESLPGGDDLDLSIRVREGGQLLVADRRTYLHHHGGQTGQRVFPGQWDSGEHQAATYNALIHKHGLKAWWEMMNTLPTSLQFLGERAHAVRELRVSKDPLAQRYHRLVVEPSDMNEHMQTLYRYASSCRTIIETGTNDCTSTTALLYAQPDTLDCYDIERFPEVDELEQLAGKTRLTFHLGDVLEAEFPEDVDMWFCDDFHEGDHVRKELERFAHRVKRYIAFHDTNFFSTKGEEGGEGIWAPIAEYMRAHPEWRLVYSTEKQNGLTVYARVA